MVQWINDWGGICDEGWDTNDTAVFCNQLVGHGG